MEILNHPTAIFPKASFNSHKFSVRNNHHSKSKPKISRYLTLSFSSPFSDSKRFRISAHFGRPTNRRNSLRKKLTEQRQVRDEPITFDPSSNSVTYRVETDDILESDSLKESKSDVNVDFVLLNQLKSWADQYEADFKFWGIGSGRIFTVFQNSEGKVERVHVDEDEILRRGGLDPSLYNESEREDLTEVNMKISHAKYIAREIENGNNLLPENSSVVKFVVAGGQSNFITEICRVILPRGKFSRLSKVGIAVLCVFFVVGAMKRFFAAAEDKTEYTSLDKEMLRRKMKARMDKEELVKGSLEVIQVSKEPELRSTERPTLDRQDLIDSILKAKASNDSLALQKSSGVQTVKSTDFDDKIREIRAMARNARELEKNDKGGTGRGDAEDNQIVNGLSNAKEVREGRSKRSSNSPNVFSNGHLQRLKKDVGETMNPTSSDDPKGNNSGIHEVTMVDSSEISNSSTSEITVSNESWTHELKDKNVKGTHLSDVTETQSNKPKKISVKAKQKIIKSVKEAREYLLEKRDRQLQHEKSLTGIDGETSQEHDRNCKPGEVSIPIYSNDSMHAKPAFAEGSLERNDSTAVTFSDPKAADDASVAIDQQISRASLSHEVGNDSRERGPSSLRSPSNKELERQRSHKSVKNDTQLQVPVLDASYSVSVTTASEGSAVESKGTIPTKNSDAEATVEGRNHQMPIMSLDSESSGGTAGEAPSVQKENWMEKNFHEFEPLIQKIAVGFTDNYKVAREKVQELNLDSEMKLAISAEDDGEFDWMKDDRLREIVFQVRENELMGRDPFHLMDAEDKQAFFNGLEKKAEKVNEKLQTFHQWVHSNIENLDYGADGISVNDPPEKFIPRWKGPPIDATPEFLDDYLEQRKALFTQKSRSQFIDTRDDKSPLEESAESVWNENGVTTSTVYTENRKHQDAIVKPPKIIIEGSDGSVRAGKKSGKEYWQHTKKWSQGFIECYNAETDPEVKATMKDIGKDLDRWITEKEIQETADLMDKIPERGRRFVQEKLNKVKREMELFGPQAVVSKYSEYADEKEEDYLWWLDLPFVLCIELYTNQDGDQNVGFYSLEMATDLELEPKQYHVIAFEDASDCKNMCYIIQGHMEMLGSGNAFVIALPPKDVFRDAKANGFSVTVIRKMELKLNADQTLEEVEEQITEIGSKMYHDKIMKGRSVDISSLTKGVFGVKKPMRRRMSKRKLKRPTKH